MMTFVIAPPDYDNPQSLDLNSADVDLNKVSWGPGFSQAKVPPSRLAELKPIITSQITKAQWAHGDNLELATDLHQAPAAWDVIQDKHGITGIDLSSGSATYKNGMLLNGGVSLPLTDPGLAGVTVVSRGDKGFDIEKAGSGQEERSFSIGKNQFTTSGKAVVHVVDENKFELDKGASLIDKEGTKVISFADGTRVETTSQGIEVRGSGHLVDRYNNFAVIGDRNIGLQGEGAIRYGENGYTFQDAVSHVGDGRLELQATRLQGDLTLYDEQAQQIVGDRVLGILKRKSVKENPRCETDCQYTISTFGGRDIELELAQEFGLTPQDLEQVGVPVIPTLAGVGVVSAVIPRGAGTQEFATADGTFSSSIRLQDGIHPSVTGRLGVTQLELRQEGRGGTVEVSYDRKARVGLYVEPTPKFYYDLYYNKDLGVSEVEAQRAWAHFDLSERDQVDISVSLQGEDTIGPRVAGGAPASIAYQRLVDNDLVARVTVSQSPKHLGEGDVVNDIRAMATLSYTR